MSAHRTVSVEVIVTSGTQFTAEEDANKVAALLNEFLSWKNETCDRPFSITIETRNVIFESGGR